LLIAFVAIRVPGFVPAEFLRHRRAKLFSLALALLAGIAIGGLGVTIACSALQPGAGEPRQHFTTTFFGAFNLLTTWIVQPAILEEIGFRGYLLPRLHRRYGVLAAILLSTLAFVAFHAYPVPSNTSLWFAGTAGIAFGSLAVVTRSIWPAVLAHFVSNALVMVLALRLCN